jgi:flagellar basal body-associated protein FliL
MELKKKKPKSRRIIVTVSLIVALAVAGGGYWAWMAFGQGGADSTDSNKQTDKKDKDDKNSDNKSDNKAKDQPTIEPEKDVNRDTPPTGETLGVWVTSKNIVNGTLQIRVQIDQNIGSGTCTLTIGSYSTSVPVAPEPQSASCQGFDVPTDAYSGSNFTITVKDGDKTGSVTGAIQ